MIGRSLSHFVINDRLGEGGMGVVYRATDGKLGRQVAIKVLPEHLIADPERLARFEREARVLATLNHPGIAAIYEVGEADETRFLVMELAEGEDLAARLGSGAMSIEAALAIALQIAEALEAAHAAGVVHRDLKPANVMVSADGRVKVLDFGLAKALEQNDGSGGSPEHSPTLTAAMTGADVILGTAAYMSPEQAKGGEADKRADIWSFGIVLCEMLTGRRVFQEDTVSETLAAVLKTDADLGALPPATPSGIRRLLKRCLQKDPRQRLHDIADARLEIEAVLRGDETEPADTVAESRRGNASGWKIAAAIASIVAVAALASHGWLGKAAPARSAASHFALTIPPSDIYSTLQNRAVALSPDGRILAYAAEPEDPVEVSQIYLQYLDRFAREPVPDTLRAYGPFFSPDGQWIGYFKDNAMWKAPVRGGPATRLAPVTGTARGASWVDDDRIFYSPTWFSPILAVAADGGEPREVTHLGENEKSHRFPSALPDGSAVIFTVGEADTESFDNGKIEVYSLASGERKVLVEGGSFGRFLPPDRLLYGRRGRLFAVGFDAERLELTGTPEPVVDDLLTSPVFGSSQFDVAANGTLAYMAGSPDLFNSRVVEVSRTGELTELPLPPNPYTMAVPSPDGKRLALRVDGANGQIWVYDLERGTLSKVTHEWDADYPVWHPDGQTVGYVLSRGGTSDIAQVRIDGSARPELLWKGGSNLSYMDWTPDGRRMVFADIDPDTDADLWLLDLDADPPVRSYLRTPAREGDPVISPDGKWLAYTSNQSGREEIYVQAFPTPDRRWQISARGGKGAVWSPATGELLYKSGATIMAVPVEPGDSFRAGIPKALFTLPNALRGDDTRPFSVSADGRFIAVLPREGWQPTGSLHLVLDWVHTLPSGSR